MSDEYEFDDSDGYHESQYQRRRSRGSASPGAVGAIRQKLGEVSHLVDQSVASDSQPRRSESRVREMLAAFGDPADWELSTREAERILEAATAILVGKPEDRESLAFELNSAIAAVFDVRKEDKVPLEAFTAQKYEAVDRIRFLDHAEQAAIRVERAEDTVRDIAGETSSYALGEHYSSVAYEEESAANWFRGLAIGLVVLTSTILFLFPLEKGFDAQNLFRRGTLISATIVVAGYFAREASQHRRLAREYRSTEVRVKTVWGYAEGLSDPYVRTQFLMATGLTFFSAPVARDSSQNDNHIGLVDMDQVLALLSKLAEGRVPRP